MTTKWETAPLSHLAKSIPASATLAISARAKALAAEGHDVVDLGVGEPDFETPSHIVEAAFTAVREGATHYTPAPGTPALRAAAAEYMGKACGYDLRPENVIISAGAKYSLTLVLQALLNPGDKVLIPAPYWVSYPVMAQLAGGEPVIVPTTLEDRFKLSPEALRQYLDDRCRLLILNSPSNPTGVGYTRADLQALARVITAHPGLWVLCDDIYRLLTYDGFTQHALAAVDEDVARRCVIVDGVSKTYAMTGWRIGYTAGPPELITAMSRIQSQTTSNPAAVSQAAALAALTGPQDCVEKMRKAFASRRQYVASRLDAMAGVQYPMPDGAFYVFADFSGYMGRTPEGAAKPVQNDMDLAEHFISAYKVATVPGTAFGAPGCIRFSYAASEKRLAEGFSRIELALSRLA